MTLSASSAVAEGYADHHMTQLFTARPCGEVVSTIDWLNTAEPPNLLDEASTQKFIEGAGMAGMAWGVLLGIDLERGGLHTSGQTTLERLRTACIASPDQTAKAILDNL